MGATSLRLLGHQAKSEGVPLVELFEAQLDAVFDRFEAAGKSRTSVIVSMRGNYHVVFGLLEPAQPFIDVRTVRPNSFSGKHMPVH
ncbi:hypothetical protein [Breoghania sp.]|uniref:hypothetical protein n=1 Tax=Breoghania sp. TaxID=2065378 RepID=UPI002AA863C5|nr:hypothetical protein [Breoghania sp.]